MSGVGWIPERNGNGATAAAVLGGNDTVAGPIYVGRVTYKGEVIPAKVCPKYRLAYFTYGGQENQTTDYEMLVTSKKVLWKDDSDGNVPSGALPAGKTADGETLYVGRADVKGNLTPGKVQPSAKVSSIPYDGRDNLCRQYSVLVLE